MAIYYALSDRRTPPKAIKTRYQSGGHYAFAVVTMQNRSIVIGKLVLALQLDELLGESGRHEVFYSGGAARGHTLSDEGR